MVLIWCGFCGKKRTYHIPAYSRSFFNHEKRLLHNGKHRETFSECFSNLSNVCGRFYENVKFF